MVLYLFNKCDPTIKVEVSSISVGEDGNIENLLSSLSYEVESELALA